MVIMLKVSKSAYLFISCGIRYNKEFVLFLSMIEIVCSYWREVQPLGRSFQALVLTGTCSQATDDLRNGIRFTVISYSCTDISD